MSRKQFTKVAGTFCAFSAFWLIFWATGAQAVTSVIQTDNAEVIGAYGEGGDCASKQQALRTQLQICRNHGTLSSCLDQFVPSFRKKFPKCSEEASAACLESCSNGMTYSYCAKFCKSGKAN